MTNPHIAEYPVMWGYVIKLMSVICRQLKAQNEASVPAYEGSVCAFCLGIASATEAVILSAAELITG